MTTDPETLKDVVRSLTPRNFRCHRRKVFFKRLFKVLREVLDEEESHVSGYIQCDDECYKEACHVMAGSIPFHPFDETKSFYIGGFFKHHYPERLFNELGVKIVRTSPIWKLLLGYGNYEVTVFGVDDEEKPINYQYNKKIWPI